MIASSTAAPMIVIVTGALRWTVTVGSLASRPNPPPGLNRARPAAREAAGAGAGPSGGPA